MKIVGVLGAGVVGRGVAQVLAAANYRVILVDPDSRALASAIHEIEQNLRLSALSGKSELSHPQEILKNVTLGLKLDACADAEVIIENVNENWELKKNLHLQIDAVCLKIRLIAVNTSAIPIAGLAALTSRRERFVGMHFMNPVHLIDAVEVIRARDTSEETLDSAIKLLTSIGKKAIIVNDAVGFVSNRILMLLINEACRVLQEETAPAKTIDMIFRRCIGHKMGPLETADMIGLDTVVDTLNILHDAFGQERFKPCSILLEMVNSGATGRKNQRGFYEY